jgi:hypothetical protein
MAKSAESMDGARKSLCLAMIIPVFSVFRSLHEKAELLVALDLDWNNCHEDSVG